MADLSSGNKEDKAILDHIEALVGEEQELFSLNDLTEVQHRRLNQIQIELDQYWDLLRQRRALREAGRNPDTARVRDPGTIGSYKQ